MWPRNRPPCCVAAAPSETSLVSYLASLTEASRQRRRHLPYPEYALSNLECNTDNGGTAIVIVMKNSRSDQHLRSTTHSWRRLSNGRTSSYAGCPLRLLSDYEPIPAIEEGQRGSAWTKRRRRSYNRSFRQTRTHPLA